MSKKFVFFFLISFLMPFCSRAENFVIKNYEVNLKVEKDKTTTVVENIKVFFHTPSHGIFRTIPVGLREKIFLNYVSEDYKTSYENGNYVIKIGDANQLVSGEHDYTIVYVHTMLKKPREFYYNLIGTGWPVDIERVSFNVEFPEPIDPQKVGLSIGSYGYRGFENGAEYGVEDNRIFGHTEEPLVPYNGITLRVEVPEGYFFLTKDNMPLWVAPGLAFLTIVCIVVWFFIGKDKQVIPVINFYPPKSFNSAEFEVLYQGKASSKGLVSLIFYLADKGYLKIEQKGKDFTLHKLKDYDGIDKTTARFMNILFEVENSISLEELQSSEDFYKDCKKIIKDFNHLRLGIFHENSISLFYRFILGIAIAGIIGLNLFIISGFDTSVLEFYGVLSIFPIVAIVVWVLNYKKSVLHYTLWALIYGGIPLMQMFSETSFEFLREKWNACLMLFGLGCLAVSAVCLYQLPKRNKFGRRILGEIEGFKKFLETAEVPKVKALAEQDHNYGSHILPYLYLFGLSTSQMIKFSSILTQKPIWFDGDFTSHSFNYFSSGMEKSVIPTVKNGGISRSSGGGGGFSGGGCGGGGGGSW